MPTKALRTWEDAVKVAARSYSRTSPIDNLTWATEKEHVNAIMRGSKQLQEAIPESIRQSILMVASMGLSLNPALQHCYLIPRRASRKNPNSPVICYPSPSYRGLSKIAMDSGDIVQIRAEVVFKADKFKYRGPVEKPQHEPVVTETHRTEQQAIGVYGICEFKNGSFACEYVDRSTVQTIRSMSDNPNGPMYTSLWTEGWKKIAIRRLCKTLNFATTRFTVAMDVLNTYEGIDSRRKHEDDVIEGEATRIPDEEPEVIATDYATELRDLCDEAGLAHDKFCEAYGIDSIDNLPSHLYDAAKARVESYKERAHS